MMINALINQGGCVLNKGKAYLEIYYGIMSNVLGLELDDYHLNWFENKIVSTSHNY